MTFLKLKLALKLPLKNIKHFVVVHGLNKSKTGVTDLNPDKKVLFGTTSGSVGTAPGLNSCILNFN